MNTSELKTLFYPCLFGTMATSRSFRHEVAFSNHFTFYNKVTKNGYGKPNCLNLYIELYKLISVFFHDEKKIENYENYAPAEKDHLNLRPIRENRIECERLDLIGQSV